MSEDLQAVCTSFLCRNFFFPEDAWYVFLVYGLRFMYFTMKYAIWALQTIRVKQHLNQNVMTVAFLIIIILILIINLLNFDCFITTVHVKSR